MFSEAYFISKFNIMKNNDIAFWVFVTIMTRQFSYTTKSELLKNIIIQKTIEVDKWVAAVSAVLCSWKNT